MRNGISTAMSRVAACMAVLFFLIGFNSPAFAKGRFNKLLDLYDLERKWCEALYGKNLPTEGENKGIAREICFIAQHPVISFEDWWKKKFKEKSKDEALRASQGRPW